MLLDSHGTNRHECLMSITWYPGSRWFAVVSNCYCVKKKHWIFSVHHSTEGKWDRGKQNWRWVCALLAGNLTPGATVFATLFLKSIWFSKNSNSLRHKSLVSVFSVRKQEAPAWSPQLLCWDEMVGECWRRGGCSNPRLAPNLASIGVNLIPHMAYIPWCSS